MTTWTSVDDDAITYFGDDDVGTGIAKLLRGEGVRSWALMACTGYGEYLCRCAWW